MINSSFFKMWFLSLLESHSLYKHITLAHIILVKLLDITYELAGIFW